MITGKASDILVVFAPEDKYRKQRVLALACVRIFSFLKKTPENVFVNLLRKLKEDLGGTFMTNEQKNKIEEYRRNGVGYKQIAKKLEQARKEVDKTKGEKPMRQNMFKVV